MHAGPCFAVTMNGTLDYFGSAVNLAARIQAHSTGSDIVLDQELAAQPDIHVLLSELETESLDVELKGFGEKPRILVRARVPTP